MKNKKIGTGMSQTILKINRMTLIFILSVLFPLMTSCKDPYAIKTGNIDYSGPQTKAAIQFSDPQLYKREALINERRDELEYLNKLLWDSRTQSFEPELMRELELISSFSASIGVKFDPASEINFDRALEVGNLEQEIQTTKLQFQLSQLKRDLELLENQLAEQETPSETVTSGGSNITSAPAGPSPPSKNEIKEIITRLGTLVKSAVARLDKKSEPLRKSGAQSSPRDLFLDRQAYRSDLRNAINAVSLDELHDYQGNSLYRMQFQATVLPGVNLDKLGILRMKLASPEYDANNPDDQKILEDLYLKWLGHLTRRLNQIGHDGEIRPNPVALQLGATGVYFDILEYQIPRPDKKKKTGTPKNTCTPGVVIGTPDNINCQIIRIATPPGTARDIAENYYTIKQKGSKHVKLKFDSKIAQNGENPCKFVVEM